MKKIISLLLSLSLISCSSMYFNTLEKFGVHKRDLLVTRVEAARDSQKDAQKQFKTALESFKDVTHFNGGELESKYDKLKQELDASEARATDVHKRIEAVDSVANALFSEWKGELGQYKDESLRKISTQELEDTKARYAELYSAMKKAESRIDPVLQPLRDQVLFLKHNLNARAIGSLNEQVVSVQSDVDALLRDLKTSIDEADRFIQQLDK